MAKARKRKAPARNAAKRARKAPPRRVGRKAAKPAAAGRVFGKGRFHVTHEKTATWDSGLRGYFAYRDLGMAERTGGQLRAHVIRPNGRFEKAGDLHYHVLDFQMVYVLKGWARVHFEGHGEVRFEAGSCMYQEPGIRHRVLEYSDDYTVIEILVPADPETVSVAP